MSTPESWRLHAESALAREGHTLPPEPCCADGGATCQHGRKLGVTEWELFIYQTGYEDGYADGIADATEQMT